MKRNRFTIRKLAEYPCIRDPMKEGPSIPAIAEVKEASRPVANPTRTMQTLEMIQARFSEGY